MRNRNNLPDAPVPADSGVNDRVGIGPVSSLPAGRFAALIGVSGPGKTTLLNCMGGLEPPDRGEVLCCHTSPHRLGSGQLSRFRRSQIGFVFQRGNLLSYLNVVDNIGLPLALNGIRGNAAKKRVEELLEAVGLPAAARALPHEWSAGETQRISVARALVHRPKLLLAVAGCAYRHYLGMHGPSVRSYPDVHEGVTQDAECRKCHDPAQEPGGPPTSHPQFTGCLKCHNDPV